VGAATRTTDAPTRAERAALALILVASFMVVLDFSIVNVALPAIEQQLGFSTASLQWVVTAYAITFGGLLILGGRAADLFGRRAMFIAGLAVFAVASLAGGLATDQGLLIAARAVQGIGAAMVAPAALSLVTTSFPEGGRRTRALGLYGATASIGFVAGLVLGGVLVQYLSWRAVFWVNVPVGVVAALLAPRYLAKGRTARRTERLDGWAAVLVTGGIAAAVYAISEGPELGYRSPAFLGAVLVAVGALVAFVAVERRHPAPLVRLGIFSLRTLRSANIAAVALGIWSAGEMVIMTLYLQDGLHYSAVLTGLALAPQGVAGLAAGMRGARLAARFGTRRLLVLTTASAMLGFVLLSRLPANSDYALMLVAILLAGFGTAGTAFASTVAGSAGIADDEQGLAGGLITMSRQVGAAIGVALLIAVARSGETSSVSAGIAGDHTAMLVAAGVALGAVIVSWTGIDRVARRPLG
jgi:EmrB/QacA subfamily drug resistance transporter